MKGLKKYLIIYFIVIFFLMGCSDTGADNALKIHPPLNQQLSIRGTWEVVEDLSKEWQSKSLQISEDYILMGEELLQSPSYKIRRVNVEEYFFYNPKSDLNNITFSAKEIDVITITDSGQFIGDILVVNPEEIILHYHNNSIFLRKLSNTVEITLEDSLELPESFILENAKALEAKRTALLISLKTPDGKHSYTYRTIFLAIQNNELRSSLESNGIYFPRRSGFWQISLDRKVINNFSQDYVFASNILAKPQALENVQEDKLQELSHEFDIYRNIQYLGNDYISIEETIEKGGITANSTLSIIPVDSLPAIKKINISDLLSDKGVVAMDSARNKVLEDKGIPNSLIYTTTAENTNLSLERKLGRWIFKGRLSYILDNAFRTEDFYINLIPPSNLVFYDDLAIAWTNVKDKVPGAIDVYTSPNKDVAIIITKTELLAYTLYGGEIVGSPIKKIKLNSGDSIIMAEWATGQYMEIWEKTLNSILIN